MAKSVRIPENVDLHRSTLLEMPLYCKLVCLEETHRTPGHDFLLVITPVGNLTITYSDK